MSTAFIHHRRVEFAETDLAGIVHFSWYFRYMEEAEHALWRAAGLSIAPRDATVGWPRVAAAFDYKSPLRFEDEFEVAVRIARVSRRTLQYGFALRCRSAVIGHGSVTAACVTKLPDGQLASIDLPEGLVDRLTGAMTGVDPMTRPTGP
jgi:YbgC/YbaW family acyl-CoA thioester hydrolase